MDTPVFAVPAGVGSRRLQRLGSAAAEPYGNSVIVGCRAVGRAIVSWDMKVLLRRIGNSLGVILPRAVLAAWGMGEGDVPELNEQGLRPPTRTGFSHQELDQLRRALSLAVVRRCTPREIRAQILANLDRWEARGVWVSAYDEWRRIARCDDDGALFAAMLGSDEGAVRLRQSMPYVGLLPQSELRELYEEAGATQANPPPDRR